MHSHQHHSAAGSLRMALGANTVLLVAQVVGAVVFGSLALWADTVHQGSDVLSLIIAVLAVAMAARGATSRYSFGLKRAEVMGALINAVLLVAAALWIVVEATRRLGDPPEVNGLGVFLVALVGLIVNGGSAWLLKRTGDQSVNVAGAALHLLSDAAGSLGVVIAGVAIMVWDARWVDPAVSYLIAALVLWSGVGLVRRTIHILLEGTPQDIDLDRINEVMIGHPQVSDVHHLHIWSVDSTTAALSAHVVVAADTLHDAQEISAELEGELQQIGISHATLALECHPCQGADCR
ncbi:MAG TPA: cation transporter [Acidimicrobiia bacterium]|nr:cation transporter [Acidimicrobiia bacterium]HIL46366.1 cation transporter [Acidimicrobiia bacterium]